jgi:hypothetical protein
MRILGATLESAQQLPNRNPYIQAYFVHGTDHPTYHNGKLPVVNGITSPYHLLSVDHTESPYSTTATLYIHNPTRDVPDLRGYSVSMGYGDYTIPFSTADYAVTPLMWVKHQQTVTSAGQCYEVLQCEGIWEYLAEQLQVTIGSAPDYQTTWNATDTVYVIMDDILTAYSLGLETLTVDDSIINTYKPIFTINTNPMEYADQIIRRLISMTKCYLRPTSINSFDVLYPQSGDTVQEAYNNATVTYPYYEFQLVNSLLIPNSVVCIAKGDLDANGNFKGWTLGTMITSAEAVDSGEVSKYVKVQRVEFAPLITTQGDADLRAEAVLAKARSEMSAGKLIAPHDARVELYDKIGVTPHTGSAFSIPSMVRVSSIRHYYKHGTYLMEVSLGGVEVGATVERSAPPKSLPVYDPDRPLTTAPAGWEFTKPIAPVTPLVWKEIDSVPTVEKSILKPGLPLPGITELWPADSKGQPVKGDINTTKLWPANDKGQPIR